MSPEEVKDVKALVATVTYVNLSDLIYVPELINGGINIDEVINRFSETNKVTFGDAQLTMINITMFSDIVEELSDFTAAVNVKLFNDTFGQDTLINLDEAHIAYDDSDDPCEGEE